MSTERVGADDLALQVRGLTTEFEQPDGFVRAVDGVSFSVGVGGWTAIVGESGSGKSVLLQSLLGLVRGAPGVVAGQVILRFRDRTEHRPYLDIEKNVKRSLNAGGQTERVRVPRRWGAKLERRMRPLRGRRIGLVLQNGRAALDPFYSVGQQLTAMVAEEGAAAGRIADRGARARRVEKAEQWLERLGFEDSRRVMALYPHELSGGMAQRVMLGMVLAQEPELLLLDEVTTGLDVSLQASVVDLLGRLHADVGFTAVLVTHDLGVARALSSQLVIMRKGRVDQAAGTDDLFEARVRPTSYAARLLEHGHVQAGARLAPTRQPRPSSAASDDEPGPTLLAAEGVHKRFGGAGWPVVTRRTAVEDVSLSARVGECLALVGESGSGKTTLVRLLSGLSRPDVGRVTWAGQTLGRLRSDDAERLRNRRTVLFQNPYTSLNPAMTSRAAVAEALIHDLGLGWRAARAEAERRLEVVELQHRADQLLGQLSGGERRRVGLVSALHAPGEVLVLDEPTAGLDAEQRAGVRWLIHAARALQPQRTILLVSHDIGFVLGTADRVVVLYRGRVVEEAQARDFLHPDRPHHPYTQLLWSASRYVSGTAGPEPLSGHETQGRVGLTIIGQEAEGCVFQARCPVYRADSVRWSICRTHVPELRDVGARRRIACHGVRDAEL